ncbi:hypothetical protein ACV07N_02770 [Roseivirga echinicomitans]
MPKINNTGILQPYSLLLVFKSMYRVLLLAIVSIGIADLNVWGQTKSHFVVQDDSACEKINFYLKASSGTCEIRTRNGETPINIMGLCEEEYITPEFGQQMEGNVLNAWLNLNDSGKEGFTSKMYKIFGRKSTDTKNYWNIYFTNLKPYTLDLNYGVGKAYIDLSNIAVENLKISSGNAHVKVGYHSRKENLIEMDTFMVNVDMGDIEIDRLNMARARTVIAEVGFGTLTMNFDQSPAMASEIWAKVGAGSLTINLPLEEIPMMIRIKETSFRKLKMPSGFTSIGASTYVNPSYKEDSPNLLTFNIDLSMGNVVFAKN